MKLHPIVCVLPLVLVSYADGATVAAFSTLWTPMIGNYDATADQQGNIGGDIVGSGTNYGLLMTFNDNGSVSNTDGTLGFRIRLDTATPPANKPAFDRAAWIGIDADLNGSVDVFIGINYSGSSNTLGIYAAGLGANNSPATTSISTIPYNNPLDVAYVIGPNNSTPNFNFRPVDFGVSKDGGTTNDVTTATTSDPDFYVSFMVPFADVVGFLATKSIVITDQTSLRYIAATSTQANSINQDIGGVTGGTTSTSTWAALGGFTQVVNSSGTVVVPEPSTSLLALAGLTLAVTRRKRAVL